VPAITPEEFEATRSECALTIAMLAERLMAWRTRKLELMMVTRAQIEQSHDLMAWADELSTGALLKGRA
jgi:hypothetical protein